MAQLSHCGRERGPSMVATGAMQLRGLLLRAAVILALAAPAACLGVPAARAQAAGGSNGSGTSGLTVLMRKLGIEKPLDQDENIHYTERPPLVVPPTRDLPPPGAPPPLAPDWPHGPAHQQRAEVKQDLVQTTPTPINNPNPPFTKHWYNPASWFSREEYATFKGEPAREHLTDPPVGYRTPSPNEPYGIGPDQKGRAAKVTDFGYTPVTGGK